MQAKRWQAFQYHDLIMQKTIIPAFENVSEYLPFEADRLRACGYSIHAAICTDCGSRHYVGHTSCRHRWCAKCAHKKSLSWLARLSGPLLDWVENGGKLALLTLTVRDTDKLTDSLTLLEKSFRYMVNHDKTIRQKFKERYPGGVRSLEVKIGKGSGKWHPHLHCLLLQTKKRQRDIDWLREAWQRAVRINSGADDGNGILDIRVIDTKKDNGITKGILESVKYITKADNDLFTQKHESRKNRDDIPRLVEAFQALYGKKAQSTWGVLRGLLKEVDEYFHSYEENKLKEFACQACGATEAQVSGFLYDQIKDFVLLDFAKENLEGVEIE